MLSYILQMIACSGILYGYYHFFLRNEKFHQYNRFYLLLSMVLSLVLPLIKIPLLPAPANNNNSIVYAFVSTGETVTISNHSNGMNGYLLYALYMIPVLLLLIRLIISIQRIIRLKQESSSEKFNNITLVYTAHPNAPFSFFSWLFWNKNNNRESTDGKQIWQHELYHIRSKHSWDLVFLEIVLSIFWFNPFFYLYRKEIKTIQEFLADQHATINSNPTNYAELLVLNALGVRHQKIVNPFFHNQIKRRITMLTSSKKPQFQWLRKLLVLPVVFTAIVLFAFTYKKEIKMVVNEIPIIASNTVPSTDTIPAKNKQEPTEKVVSVEYETSNTRYQKLKPVTVVGFAQKETSTKVLKDGEYKIDVAAAYPGNWKTFLERNIDLGKATQNGAPPGNYVTEVQFIINEDGSLSNFVPLTREGFGMEDEVIRVLKKSEKWNPALNNKDGGEPKPVKSYRTQPVEFVVYEKKKSGSSGREVFTKVEHDAKYPGNWLSFLQRNLDGQVSVDNGAKPGTYTTIIQFIVDVSGNISDIKPLTNHGYGMEKEAMRVIEKSGKWTPAVQNGREVTAYRKQPITFQVTAQ